MIRTPTTFIIGAGASKPYGYPTGAALRNMANTISPHHPTYQLIHQSGIASIDELNRFLDDLRQHPAYSIDAFLEHRQDDAAMMRVGRAVIAGTIGTVALQLRDAARAASASEDWLAFVIEKMRSGASKWMDFANGNNRVRFVTFNFDDVVEDRLAKAVAAIYRGQINLAAREVELTLGNFPVIHVHGRLPSIPLGRPESDSVRELPRPWLEWIVKATESVKVVLDDIDQGVLEQARKAILEADVLCFLGFAYATENLTGRLQLPTCLARRTDRDVLCFGSATNETEGARRRVLELFDRGPGHTNRSPFTLGTPSQNRRKLLEDYYILRG